MDRLLDQLYYTLTESMPSAWQVDPEYRRLSQEYDRLWNQIAADLGQDGRIRLDKLESARETADYAWQKALFRRTLAFGIALGQLQSAL